MKKTLLLMLLAGSSCAVFAQNDSLGRMNGNMNRATSTDTMNSLNRTSDNSAWGDNNQLYSNSNYNAYGLYTATAPDYVQGYVLRDYPMATNLHWQQNNDWWHAYYLNGTEPMNVYYNNAGQTFTVSLPVKQSLIPDDVSNRAIQNWGPEIYDIVALKGAQGQDIYQVRIIENGTVSSQYMDAEGNKVIDIYRDDSNNSAFGNMPASNSQDMNTDNSSNSMQTPNSTDVNSSGQNMEEGKLKIKTKTSDGKKTKTKIENGKVKTKTDE